MSGPAPAAVGAWQRTRSEPERPRCEAARAGETLAVLPMKATTGPLPTGPGWIYEVKWDGMRGPWPRWRPRVCTGGAPTAGSAPRRSRTGWSPEALAPVEATLDGEVVAFDDERRPELRPAAAPHARGRPRRRRPCVGPATFPSSTCVRPAAPRRHRPDAIARDRRRVPPRPARRDRRLVADVRHQLRRRRGVLKARAERGLEGVVAKRPAVPLRARPAVTRLAAR